MRPRPRRPAFSTALTVAHAGTGLYVLATVELACLPLAVSAVVWALAGAHRRTSVVVLSVCAAVLLWQSVSLLASPKDPRAFVCPGARIAYSVNYTAAEVQRSRTDRERVPAGPCLFGNAVHRLRRRKTHAWRPARRLHHGACKAPLECAPGDRCRSATVPLAGDARFPRNVRNRRRRTPCHTQPPAVCSSQTRFGAVKSEATEV